MIKDEWYAVSLNSVIPNSETDVIKFYDETGLNEVPCEILIGGYDGVYRSKVPRSRESYPEDYGRFQIIGGSRLLFAMKCSANASMKLSQRSSTIFYYGIDDPIVPIIVQFNIVDGEKTEASPYADEQTLTQWEPPRPDYLEDLTSWEGTVEKWDLTTEVVGLPGPVSKIQPMFNNKIFSTDTPSHTASYESVQEWSFYNTAGIPGGHPMHVHMSHMQILGYGNMIGVDCGPNFEFGEWYDTLRVASSDMDPCTARLKFNDYSSKVIVQCQDLMHADVGMMGWVQVEGGPMEDQTQSNLTDPVNCKSIL